MEVFQTINDWLSNYVLIILLLSAALYFTFITRGVQFRMFGQMWQLLARSGSKDNDRRDHHDKHHSVSSFQAFSVSIASRVGTGNLAGVATAIAIGGPGAIFWMWVIALLGSASAFVESTLAQLYKVKGPKSFMGGPAYYILLGLRQRWWAVTFAVLITVTFALAFNAVQAQTISDALSTSFGVPNWITGLVLTVLTLLIIFGGIQGIARFSQWIVPVMAIAYIVLALVIVIMNFHRFPDVMLLIVKNAFGFDEALGGSMGMAVVWGMKRGLFSNEAGEGSAPNIAATASVSHPVKQGLIQSLGVFTDTILICSCTAFIILCSDVWRQGYNGITLTQMAIDNEIGVPGTGSTFICIAIFFFAFTSIVANYYYGENNILFITGSHRWVVGLRWVVGAIVYLGSVTSLDVVWGFADITMALMTICNLVAIAMLGKYAVICLKDYQRQLRMGKDPVYHASTIPEIEADTQCWR